MKRIATIVLCLAVALCAFTGCGSIKTVGKNDTVPTANKEDAKTVIGSGSKSFIWEYIDENGEICGSYIIKTNYPTVGSALSTYKLAEFTVDEKGNETITISNVPTPQGKEWKFYSEGIASPTSPSDTQIYDGYVYTFAAK